MTTAHNIDLPTVLAERLTTAHPDVLRELLATFIHTLMGAEADALCGAGYGERSAERTNSRNGYRHRQFDTRAGTLDLAIPKLRQGSYFPDWLLERRKRAERALTTVVATCYLLGVSTRRMDKLVETLGITSLSKSQVSVMAKELDAAVEAFRTRPLDAGPYTFVAADALVLKVREAGRVVNVHALIAVGVNAEGYRYPRYRSVRFALHLLPLIGRNEARLLCARKECHDPERRLRRRRNTGHPFVPGAGACARPRQQRSREP